MDRRAFLISALALAGLPRYLRGSGGPGFRIRTITAGVPLALASWREQLTRASSFLAAARRNFEASGFEVQTIRITTPPLAEYMDDWLSPKGLGRLVELDEFCAEQSVILSVGPVIVADVHHGELADWASELIRTTERISFSVNVASESAGVHENAIRSAAETMAAVAHSTEAGEGNFRLAATAFCPPGTPFFPAGWHRGPAAFSIGLETPPLLEDAIDQPGTGAGVSRRLARVMDEALAPVQAQAESLSAESGRPYLGIDASPAPGPDASIGAVVEAMTGAPFGSPSTLSACATLTGALKALQTRTCGYSGLMLPVLEDKVLARRAAEGRYGISELLLYSSVCGTGLDVVPLPGDSSVSSLAALIGDVAALATKYRKPLSARLFPVPGKSAGDAVTFDNPFLTDSVVMALDRGR